MGSCQSWRCQRCGALTRTWRGHMHFDQVRGRWSPVCDDALGCKARAKDPPEGEFWLDTEDGKDALLRSEPEPVAQAQEEYTNLEGTDGRAWCFDCKPVGMAAVGPSEEPCNACGD